MLFSNQVDGETISFKYYHAASGEVFCLDETVDFESDMIIGNAIVPFEFNIDVDFLSMFNFFLSRHICVSMVWEWVFEE